MNYELEISKSKPAAFNALNGGVPPLVAGSGSATRLTTSMNTSFAAFNSGYEDIAFTLEVWFLPLTNTGEHVVIGHSAEGVLWDGTRFILRVKQGDGTVITEQTWRPSELKAFHVAMVYSPGQVLLYIDAEVAASLSLTGDIFFATGQAISLNAGTAAAIYDSQALYYRALSRKEVKDHYAWGNDVLSATEIGMIKGGTTWSLSYQDVPVAERFLFDTSNFSSGYADNVMVTDNLVTSTDATGIWRQSVVLSTLVGATLPGVHLTYEGEGVTMSYSLDGSTWLPVANKTTILQDSPTVDMLFVQLQLSGDDAWVSYLKVDVLADRTMNPLSGSRMLTFKSTAMDQTPGSQLAYQYDAGATIASDGYVVVTTDLSAAPVLMKTVEFWLKKTDNSNTTIVENSDVNLRVLVDLNNIIQIGAGVEVRVNGQLATNAVTLIEPGIWYHMQVVFPNANNSELWFGRDKSGANSGPLTIYGLSVYSDSPSNYSLNIGAPGLRVDDTSGLTMSDPAPGVGIYAYSWSYVSGGH